MSSHRLSSYPSWTVEKRFSSPTLLQFTHHTRGSWSVILQHEETLHPASKLWDPYLNFHHPDGSFFGEWDSCMGGLLAPIKGVDLLSEDESAYLEFEKILFHLARPKFPYFFDPETVARMTKSKE